MNKMRLFAGRNRLLAACAFLCLGCFESILKAEPSFGNKPWVTILVRFSDSPGVTPHPKSWYETLMGPTYPGMDHYFREASYGQLNLTGSVVVGWYSLPYPKSYYAQTNAEGKASFKIYQILADSTALADAAVFFPDFYGVNVMLNENIDGVGGGSGGKWNPSSPLDGTPKTYGMTVQQPPTGPNPHEMGHGFGLDHSSGPYFPDEPLFGPHTYDSFWDPMSMGADCSIPGLSCVSFHFNAYHKDVLGWIPAARKYIAMSNSSQMIEMERLALPGTNGYLMAQIFISGWATRFYTVEVRRRAGYDGNGLPGEGVLIHSVDTARPDRQSQVVDSDNNGNPNDAGAIWTSGESFYDSTNGITIAVGAATASGYQVTISIASTAAAPNFVTNTRDFGPGSLRNSINWANLFPNTTIQFRIPTNDIGFTGEVFTIQPTNSLPVITGNGTVVEGATQTTFSGDSNPNGPEIVINGSLAGQYGNGLQIVSGQCSIRSLVVNQFASRGIWLNGARDAIVRGCYVGTSAGGTEAVGNGWAGIHIGARAANNWVGDGTLLGRNIISGNASIGVLIENAGTTNNSILGNYIGTDKNGTSSLSNGWAGIDIADGASNNRIGDGTTLGRNIVSGNSSIGVLVVNPGTTNNSILGNYIGTDKNGTSPLRNGWAGIDIADGASNNRIGDGTPFGGNLISGNSVFGAWIGNPGTTNNSVLGNYIGTDKNGTAPLSNGWTGIQIDAGAAVGSPGTELEFAL